MKIIGLMGNSGVGKDTMADHLVSKYGFVKISFADPMKRIVKEVYDFADEQLYGPSELRSQPDTRYQRKDGSYLSVRIALQLLGTEWARNCYEETWTNYLRRMVDKIKSGYHYAVQRGAWLENVKSNYKGIVVADCRFLGELETVKNTGGILVRLRRDSITAEKSKNLGVKNHATETAQMEIPDSQLDHVLNVPEGIPNFHVAIDEFMKKL